MDKVSAKFDAILDRRQNRQEEAAEFEREQALASDDFWTRPLSQTNTSISSRPSVVAAQGAGSSSPTGQAVGGGGAGSGEVGFTEKEVSQMKQNSAVIEADYLKV